MFETKRPSPLKAKCLKNKVGGKLLNNALAAVFHFQTASASKTSNSRFGGKHGVNTTLTSEEHEVNSLAAARFLVAFLAT